MHKEALEIPIARNVGRSGKRGFTLVELIVVIAMLSILGTVGFISLGGYSANARDSTRVSDIANLTKSLDVAASTSGFYPSPDNFFSITYSGGTVWSQGVVGTGVISRMQGISGGGMNEKPIDPLSGSDYVYSSNANAYQLKADMEGAVTSFVDTAYAAAPAYSIKGRHSLVAMAQTGSMVYVLAIPSIITSTGSAGQTLEISSGALSGTLLFQGGSQPIGFNPTTVVHSGASLPKNDSNYEVTYMMMKVQNAYSGSSVASDTAISGVLSTPGPKLYPLGCAVLDNYLRSKCEGAALAMAGSNNTNCGTSNGKTVAVGSFSSMLCAPWASVSSWSGTGGVAGGALSWACRDNASVTSNCSANYGGFASLGATCDVSDILVGSLTGSYTVWAGCNVGASSTNDWSTTSTTRTQARDGYFFQFGRDDPFPVSGAITTASGPASVSTGVFTFSPISTFYYNNLGTRDWRSPQLSTANDPNANIWQSTVVCPSGYHIPTRTEFQSALTVAPSITPALRLTLSGNRRNYDGTAGYPGAEAEYWTSSPNGSDATFLIIGDPGTMFSTHGRSWGFNVRCIKN